MGIALNGARTSYCRGFHFARLSLSTMAVGGPAEGNSVMQGSLIVWVAIGDCAATSVQKRSAAPILQNHACIKCAGFEILCCTQAKKEHIEGARHARNVIVLSDPASTSTCSLLLEICVKGRLAVRTGCGLFRERSARLPESHSLKCRNRRNSITPDNRAENRFLKRRQHLGPYRLNPSH